MSIEAQFHAEHKARRERFAAAAAQPRPTKKLVPRDYKPTVAFAVPLTALEMKKLDAAERIADANRILSEQIEANQRLLKLAQEVQDDLDAQEKTNDYRVTIEACIRFVCREYNISRVDLISQRRTAPIVGPRQMAMYLAKTLTLRSLPEVGRRFGGRDHTTVLHAVRKIEGRPQLAAVAAEYADRLRAGE